MEDQIDEEHPAVLAIKQAIGNHGWGIEVSNAISLVKEARQALALYDQKATQALTPRSRQLEAERVVREMLAESLYTEEGDKPEIPDDLIEEIGEVLTDQGYSS